MHTQRKGDRTKERGTKGHRERQREIKGRIHIPLLCFPGPDKAHEDRAVVSRRTELETVSECQRHKEQAFLCLAVCLAPRGMLQRTNGEIPNRPRRPFPGPGSCSRPPQPEITRGGSGSCLLKSGWEEGAQVFSGGGRTRVGTVRRALVTQGSEGVEAVHWGNPTGEQQNKWERRAAGTPDPPAPLLTPTVCRYTPATPPHRPRPHRTASHLRAVAHAFLRLEGRPCPKPSMGKR